MPSINAHATPGVALVELEAQRLANGRNALHVPRPATRITLVVPDGAHLLVDDDSLGGTHTGCLELPLAQGVASVILDRAAGLADLDRTPRLLDGELYSSKERIVGAPTDRI